MKEQLAMHQRAPQRTRTRTNGSSNMAGSSAAVHPEDRPSLTGQRLSSPVERDERFYAQRTPSSARRYQPIEEPPLTEIRVTRHAVPARTTAPSRRTTQEPMTNRPRTAAPRRVHSLFYVGLVLAVIVAGWIVLNLLASVLGPWWQSKQDDQQYGRPRTFQTDVVVGHHDAPTRPSHFLALNLHGQTQVIELQGGEAAHAQVYLGPRVSDPLAPVTLAFHDVNGDHVPDMVVSVASLQTVFINDHGVFRPAKPDDAIHL